MHILHAQKLANSGKTSNCMRRALHSGNTRHTSENTLEFVFIKDNQKNTTYALIPECAYAGDPGDPGEYCVKQPDWS